MDTKQATPKPETALLHRLDTNFPFVEGIVEFLGRLVQSDQKEVLPASALGHVGKGCEASRISIFREDIDRMGEPCFVKQVEWLSDDMRLVPPHEEAELMSCYCRWRSILILGEVVEGKAGDFFMHEREVLDQAGIKSILLVPLNLRRRFYGFMAIEHRADAFEWRNVEIDLLRTATVSLCEIMEKRQAVAQLKMFEAAFRDSNDGIFIANADLNEGGPTIVFVNRAMSALTGYTEEELIGQSLRLFQGPGTSPETVAATNEKIREGKAHHGEILYYRKDGSDYTGELLLSALRDDLGRVTQYAGILRDITESKRTEERHLLVSKLESITLLAGGIAHDFNNYLAVVTGFLSLLKLEAHLNEEEKEMLDSSLRAASRAQHLTQQLLAFSKGGAPVKRAADLEEIIKESCHFATHGGKSKLDYSIQKGLWPIEADAGQISQVLQNLIINAGQAMPKGGDIYITAENYTIAEGSAPSLTPGPYVKLVVRDTGMGIPKELLDKIFDPYFTTKAEGNGLGLSTSYSIIIKHGGHISVTSQIGKGTTFTLYLPKSANAAIKKTQSDTQLLKGEGRILVLDDEESIREFIGQTLKRYGYEVQSVGTGLDAIDAYEKARQKGNDFSLVLLDLTIPGGLGGVETLKRLQNLDPKVKVIASSGYSNEEAMARHKEFGFMDVISKPYDARQLLLVIHQVLKAKNT